MLKLMVIILLLIIIGSLFSALYFTFKKDGDNLKTVKALTMRVTFSVFLFAALLSAFRFGLIPGYQ